MHIMSVRSERTPRLHSNASTKVWAVCRCAVLLLFAFYSLSYTSLPPSWMYRVRVSRFRNIVALLCAVLRSCRFNRLLFSPLFWSPCGSPETRDSVRSQWYARYVSFSADVFLNHMCICQFCYPFNVLLLREWLWIFSNRCGYLCIH